MKPYTEIDFVIVEYFTDHQSALSFRNTKDPDAPFKIEPYNMPHLTMIRDILEMSRSSYEFMFCEFGGIVDEIEEDACSWYDEFDYGTD